MKASLNWSDASGVARCPQARSPVGNTSEILTVADALLLANPQAIGFGFGGDSNRIL
jgi:hypothetical protein